MVNIKNKPKKLAVLCDGTWCGRETGTVTNISILASMIGIDMTPAINNKRSSPDKVVVKIDDPIRRVKARYFDGCGLGDTFLAYLFNGATGSDIGQECLEAYEYIVENFDDETELWVFGHSRGSYTVRCVAGMINNCGIIKRRGSAEETRSLCQEVYQMYRSPYDDDRPNSDKMKRFREKASWNLDGKDGKKTSAIKFMGIVDTVGSLGIPKLDAGVGLDYPEFYDQNISSEVEKVYHTCSMHDRLWCFEPCRARRDPKKNYEITRPELKIHEKWFPGCHYDVGRQKFSFFRRSGNIVEQTLFRIPSLLTKPVLPNEVCADLVLLYLLEGIAKEDGLATLIPELTTSETGKIALLKDRLRNDESPELGSGDVYGDIPDYAPGGIAGHIFAQIFNTTIKVADFLTPTLKLGTSVQEMLGVKTITNILLAVRDRRIPTPEAQVVDLAVGEKKLKGESVMMKAGLDRTRYPSKTFENWLSYLFAVGMISRNTWLVRTKGVEEVE